MFETHNSGWNFRSSPKEIKDLYPSTGTTAKGFLSHIWQIPVPYNQSSKDNKDFLKEKMYLFTLDHKIGIKTGLFTMKLLFN